MKAELSTRIVRNTMVEYESLSGDKHAYASVTSWANGEGFDVTLDEKDCIAHFQMTYDQWGALKKAMKSQLNSPVVGADTQ